MKKKSVKTSLYIRFLAAVYLLYTAYKLFNSWDQVKPGEKTLIMISIIIFTVTGVAIAILSAKSLYKINQEEKKARAAEYDETAGNYPTDAGTDDGPAPEELENNGQDDEDQVLKEAESETDTKDSADE